MHMIRTIRTVTTIRRLVVLLALGAAAAIGHAEPPDAAQPLPGIATSGQPDESALTEFAEDGYTAVIDLRTPEEDRGLNERETVENLGMSYISLPVDGPGGITYENAAALDAILRETGRPVLIHCSTGNRAGALLALRERLTGAAAEEALEVGVEGGMTSLRSTVEARLAEPPQD